MATFCVPVIEFRLDLNENAHREINSHLDGFKVLPLLKCEHPDGPAFKLFFILKAKVCLVNYPAVPKNKTLLKKLLNKMSYFTWRFVKSP